MAWDILCSPEGAAVLVSDQPLSAPIRAVTVLTAQGLLRLDYQDGSDELLAQELAPAIAAALTAAETILVVHSENGVPQEGYRAPLNHAA